MWGRPAYWNPDADTIVSDQAADLVLLDGADYAKWTSRASLPLSSTVNTTREVSDLYISVPDAVTHSHGPEGKHSHGGIASETWLDPDLAIAQAEVVRQVLAGLLPRATAELNANFASLKHAPQILDGGYQQAFAAFSGPWLASHPVYAYLDRRYGLSLKSLHWEPDETASEEQWQAPEQLLLDHPWPIMLWEAEPAAETAKRLHQLGVIISVFQTADRRPAHSDFLQIVRGNLQRLRAAIEARKAAGE